MTFSKLLLTAAVFPLATLASYKLTKEYSGFDFFSGFDFYSGPDPTDGHVQYKGFASANASGLVGFLVSSNGTNVANSTLPPPVYLGVDHTTILPKDTGRPSVRVSSVQVYNHSLVIADILHMPSSTCGLWPAFWMLGTSAPWPNAGEIDIVENVNDNDFNTMTLHTNSGLVVSNNTDLFNGTLLTSNCDVNAEGQAKNAGCSVRDSSSAGSYGDNFNKNGGGVFAMQYTPSHIAIWFFARNAIPTDIASGIPSPPHINNATTSPWGKPNALFQTDSTSSPPSTTTASSSPQNTITPVNNSVNSSITDPSVLDSHFASLQLVFTTTFCGTWAGAVWNSSATCSKLAPTCEEYVSSQPDAFVDAYWAIQSIQVYEHDKDNSIKKRNAGFSDERIHVLGHGHGHGFGKVYDSAEGVPLVRRAVTKKWLAGVGSWRTWNRLVPLREVV